MNIADKIQLLRKQNNLTQEQLADKLNVSRQALSKWELGVSMPEADKIIQISNLFSVSTDYLLKDSIETYENRLKRQIDPRSIAVLSTAIVLIGTIVVISVWDYMYLGFILQVVGVAMFEFLINHQHSPEFKQIRTVFYTINLWFIVFAPYMLFYRMFGKIILSIIPFKYELHQTLFMFGSYVTLCLFLSLLIYLFIKKRI
jgi:transcriptional regulator with XRE-family HTH domain